MKRVLFLLTSFLFASQLFAQENESEKKIDFSTNIDFYSRYVWRGLQYSNAPNIQPYATLTWKNLSLMGWGSYATSKDYAEIDFFLTYSNKGFEICLNDYYSQDDATPENSDYTEWGDTLTSHLIEASVSYQLPFEKFPLQLLASTFIYGADDLNEDKKQNYSTYFEIKYPLKSGDYDIELFAGGTTTHNGFYGSKASLVNVGINASRTIKITDSFEIPFTTSLTYNPNSKDIYFVIGLTL
jgi:hypothetical protein